MSMEEAKGSNRGSFELYDSQRSTHLSSGDNRPSPAMAPGCPGSPQDVQQVLEEMKKELAERKGREDNLLKIISELRGAQNSMVHSGSYGDTAFLQAEGASGSPTSENVGENVKDAHLKHLQRQVTILQASLYKAEGWTARAEEARRERDKALDDLRVVTAELQTTRDDKKKLQKECEKLNMHCADFQQRLERAMQDLKIESKHERCQAQTSRLQEELSAAKGHMETLKESVTRLSHENKSLKERSLQGVGQSGNTTNNTACTQELEYLHTVVDQLKKTVMEQRSFLVNIKPQSILGSSMSSSMASSRGESQAMKEHPFAMSKSASAALPGTLSESDGRSPHLQQQLPSEGQRLTAAGLPNMAGRLTRSQISPLHSNTSSNSDSNNAAVNGGAVPRQPVEAAGVRMNSPTASGLRYPAVAGATGGVPSHSEQLAMIGQPLKVGDGAVMRRKTALQPQNSAPLRKISQSEILARRANSDAVVLDKGRSKTDTILRQGDRLNQEGEGKSYPEWMFNNNAQQVGAMPGSQGAAAAESVRNYHTAIAPQIPIAVGGAGLRGGGYEAAADLTATAGLDGNIPQAAQFELMGNGLRLAGPSAGLPTNPPSSPARLLQTQQQQQQQQQVFHGGDSVRVINNDMMGGGRMLQNTDPSQHNPQRVGTPQEGSTSALTSSSTSSPSNWQSAHVHSPLAMHQPLGRGGGATGGLYQGEANIVSNPAPPPLNADRVCPVCSRNFEELSMEEFQTHVFECFDDENAPETMKPCDDGGSDRTCPMCNTKFGADMPQAEFEKHVHSHFEETPGENFEVLYPLT